MGKLWVVIKREYLERVRTKWFIIATVFGPIFFGTVMILPGYLSMKSLKNTKVSDIRVLDATGGQLGDLVVTKLSASAAAAPRAQVVTVDPSTLAAAETTAVHAVMTKETVGYLVLDSNTTRLHTARYAGRNASSLGEIQMIEGALRQALLQGRLERAGLDPRKIDSLTKVKVAMSVDKIDEKGRGGSGLSSLIFGGVIAFLLYFSIIVYGQNILRGVLEEKTTRVAEVVLSSVSPDTLLAGKVIGVGAVGMTQQLVWLLSTALMWNFRQSLMAKLGMPTIAMSFPAVSAGNIVVLLAFFVLGYTFYASLFAAVGAMSGTIEEAGQAAQPVMLMLVSAVIFVQPVMLNPTGKLAEWMSWLPFSAPILMPVRMSAIQVPWYEIGGSLAGVFLACLATIWLAARIYRVGLLMTGKRPSLKELGRWIRQS